MYYQRRVKPGILANFRFTNSIYTCQCQEKNRKSGFQPQFNRGTRTSRRWCWAI